MKSGNERYTVIAAMLGDKLNRMCVEHFLHNSPPNTLYPPPVYLNGFAYISTIRAYAKFKSLPNNSPMSHNVLLSEEPNAHVSYKSGEFLVRINADGTESVTGPFSSMDEAMEEAKVLLNQIYGITVSEHAPWEDL